MQTLELFPPGRALPCVQAGPDLYFSESPRELELAKQLCRPCPLRTRCLEGAKERGEPWGVWGGEVFVDGRPVPFKRSRGPSPQASAGPAPSRPPGRPGRSLLMSPTPRGGEHEMHVYMKQQLVEDHLAELRADSQRARHQRDRRVERSSEASQALARREWRVLVHALLAR